MTVASTPAARLEDRYGRTPRGRRRGRMTAIVTAAVLIVAGVVWAVLTGFGGAGNATDLQTTGFVIQSDEVTTVGWLVTGEASDPLVCAIEAQDAGRQRARPRGGARAGHREPRAVRHDAAC